MRIGNINEMSQSENRQVTTGITNYSKADYTRAIRLDITDIGKDTGFIIDQGRSIQDVIGEAGALDVQTRQDYMTVVSNTMSEEDYAKMCEEGFKPSQMSGEESVTIMDRIKAVVAQSGEMVAGYNDNLDIDTLKEITGSVANANALAEAMKNADIPQTEANAKKIDEAAKEIQGIDSIDDSSMQYMLMNNLSPTIDNIYLAKFSVGGVEKSQSKAYYSLGMQGYLAQKADTADIANIKGDIEKALEGFNLEEIDYDTQIKEANWLVEKGIDLTQSNMEKLHELTGIKLPLKYDEAARKAAYTLAKGNEPKKTDLSSSEDNVYVKASEILEKTSDIEDNQIKNVVLSGKSLTLKNIWNASNAEASVAADNISFTQGRAAIEEIRLRMTLDVNVSLLKRGIELDTMSLSNLVDALKAGEKAVNESLFGHEDAEIVEAKATIYSSVSQKISDIPFMPAAVIGRLKIEEEYSLTTVHEIGTDLKARYEAAGESYETLMTAPRRDMGDSISKAFRNVDDILKDIGLEVNEDNAKAVRILGYNSMDINYSEVIRIKEATAKVNNVVKGLTPARTLELIRQGINPMEMSVDKLAETLNSMDVRDNGEKYSRFLYKLEKSNGITESEREAYIGIYRLVNRLEKTDGAAIGALVNGNVEISFKNLLSGMRSRNFKMDETIDDNFGFMQNIIRKGVSISDQIEQAFIGRIGKQSDEELNHEYTKESYREYIKTLNGNENTVNELASEGITVSADNIAAANALVSSDSNVFNLIQKFSKQLENTDKEKLEKYKENAKKLTEGFDDRDSAKDLYKSFIEAGMDVVEDYTYSVGSTIDLNQMKLCYKQLSLAAGRSSQDKYTVPVEINGETTAINLILQHGEESSVSASFISDEFGQVTAHFIMEEHSIKGMVVSEYRAGQEYLTKVVDRMAQKSDVAMDVRVIVGKETQLNAKNGNEIKSNADINNVDTASLYKLAKSFLTEYSLG